MGAAGLSPAAARPAGWPLDELVERLLARQPRALGRAISLLENGPRARSAAAPAGATGAAGTTGGAAPGARELIGRIYPRTGRARVVGVTGPPGAGKSTLVDRLARRCRQRGETVGILAVDPTSPFTGGALLGDRIRMQSLYTDPGVFIRSMATRGAMGGLARASRDAVDLLDAAGFDWVLVETVGVGQDEVDVVRSVDSVVMVTVPGLGDDIQAIKAGILEIADVFVINKADREGVERTFKDLQMMLSIGEHGAWLPPVLKAVAIRDEGIEQVLAAVERHREHLTASGELAARRQSHLRLRVETLLKERVVAAADQVLGFDREIESGFSSQLDPYQLADRLFTGVVDAAREVGAAGAFPGPPETAAGVAGEIPGPAGLAEERVP
jgi:LAO/AO transport system kinase